MGVGREVPGEWDRSEPSELPAATLRRAISHVESMLQRYDCVHMDEATSFGEPPAARLADVTAISAAVSTTPHAKALRITLGAEEDAYRLRPDTPAEVRQMLRDARELGDRLRVEARVSAAYIVAIARRDAAGVIDAALAEADQILRTALARARARTASARALTVVPEQPGVDGTAAILPTIIRAPETTTAPVRDGKNASVSGPWTPIQPQ